MLESDAQGRTRVSVRQHPHSHHRRARRRKAYRVSLQNHGATPLPTDDVQQAVSDDEIRSVTDSWTTVTEEVSSGRDPEPFLRAAWATQVTSEPVKPETLEDDRGDGNVLVPEFVKCEHTSDLVKQNCRTQTFLAFCKEEPLDAVTMLDESSTPDWACNISREHDGGATAADLARLASYSFLESSKASPKSAPVDPAQDHQCHFSLCRRV